MKYLTVLMIVAGLGLAGGSVGAVEQNSPDSASRDKRVYDGNGTEKHYRVTEENNRNILPPREYRPERSNNQYSTEQKPMKICRGPRADCN
jgi:hypothetical protein